MKRETVWSCKIGVIGKISLPPGSDTPMRDAIADAFREIAHKEPEFMFSGWGTELTEEERNIVKEMGIGINGIHIIS